MTLTQLNYIVAVDKHKNFGHAALSCKVTQPTLSMQIHKLEQELGVIFFDRSEQPIKTTKLGEVLIR
jgi:LysR family transcriptional regulator, hydrogen peroxide-inducible genes activator